MPIFVKRFDKDGNQIGSELQKPCVGFLKNDREATKEGNLQKIVINCRKMFYYYNTSNTLYSSRKEELEKCLGHFIEWLHNGELAFLYKDVIQPNGDLVIDLGKYSYLQIQTLVSIWREPIRMQQALWTFHYLCNNPLCGYTFSAMKAYFWAVAVFPELMYLDDNEINRFAIKKVFDIGELAIRGYWNDESPFGFKTYQKDLREFTNRIHLLLKDEKFNSMPIIKDRTFRKMDVGKLEGLDSYLDTMLQNDVNRYHFHEKKRPISSMFYI
jgi:hypothetical protein